MKLAETGADGFVPAGTLGDDYFRFEEATRSLVGTRSGVAYRLGDPVRVRLVEAAPFAGALRFEIVSSETPRRRATQAARSRARTDWREPRGEPQGRAPMNDMSGFRWQAPRRERPLGEAICRGLVGRCPACGRGRLFRSLSQGSHTTCKVCGEDLSHAAPTTRRPI